MQKQFFLMFYSFPEVEKMKVLKILPRIYVNDLDSALEFCEELLGTSAVIRFEIPESRQESCTHGRNFINS